MNQKRSRPSGGQGDSISKHDSRGSDPRLRPWYTTLAPAMAPRARARNSRRTDQQESISRPSSKSRGRVCKTCRQRKPLTGFPTDRYGRVDARRCLLCAGGRCSDCGEYRAADEFPYDRYGRPDYTLCLPCIDEHTPVLLTESEALARLDVTVEKFRALHLPRVGTYRPAAGRVQALYSRVDVDQVAIR